VNDHVPASDAFGQAAERQGEVTTGWLFSRVPCVSCEVTGTGNVWTTSGHIPWCCCSIVTCG
jgi:hypothetical protein